MRVVGPYELLEPLHDRRAGSVRAVHRETGEHVALFVGGSGAVRAYTSVRHENVARVVASGVDRDEPWVAVEEIDGPELHVWLDGRLPPAPPPAVLDDEARARVNEAGRLARAIDAVAQIARGLAAIHDANLVHRGVHSGNIRVDFGPTVMLLPSDSTLIDPRDDERGLVVGVFQYISPEQALGTEVDGRADLYALGVVLYEIVAGRHPFWSENSVGYAYHHARKQPPDIHSINPAAPPALVELTMGLLRKDPRERLPADARSLALMLAALDPTPRLLDDEPIIPPGRR